MRLIYEQIHDLVLKVVYFLDDCVMPFPADATWGDTKSNFPVLFIVNFYRDKVISCL